MVCVCVASSRMMAQVRPSNTYFLGCEPGSAVVDTTNSENVNSLRRLEDFLENVSADPTAAILEIVITSSTSPDGSYEFNMMLSNDRLEAMYEKVAVLGVEDSLIVLNNKGIAWGDLRGLLVESKEEYRDTVVSIIDKGQRLLHYYGNLRIDGRVYDIKKLNWGRVWNDMKEKYFPRLRAMSVIIRYKSEEKEDVEEVHFEIAPEELPKPEITEEELAKRPVEEIPVVEETPAVEKTPVVEEEKPVVEQPVVEEDQSQNPVSALYSRIDILQPEDPAVEETPVVEEKKPVVEAEPEVKDTVVVETPVIEEKPVVEEEKTPVVEEPTPVVEEEKTPVVEETKPVIKKDWTRGLSVKTNALMWGLGITNAAVEIDIIPHLSFSIPVNYSAWNYFTETIKFRTIFTQPELRYWIKDNNQGLYVNAHFGVGSYNVAADGGWRFQDKDGNTPALGGGIGVGYKMNLSKKSPAWKVEFSLGAGIYSVQYDRFFNTEDTSVGAYYDTVKKVYYGLDGASVSFIYTFDLNKRKKEGGR